MEAANQQREAANGSWFVKRVFVLFCIGCLFHVLQGLWGWNRFKIS